MKRASLVVLWITITMISMPLRADDLEARVDYLKSIFSVWRGDGEPAGEALGVIDNEVHKCGTPLVLEAQYLEAQYGNSLGLSDYFARPSDADFPETYISPAGHFKIHYTTAEGKHQTTLGYVQTVALIADSVWAHHIDQLGYHEPLNDGDYEWGGDSLYDIYLKSLSSLYYGITWGESGPQVGNGHQATSYMELQTDYSNFPGYETRPLDALRVTMAHEFFHAIQFWYDAREHEDEVVENKPNFAWMEISSVWMEEETYDYINDYYYYLPHYFPFVHLPLRLWDNQHPNYPYAAGIFAMFLTQRFGTDIMRSIWEKCAEVPKTNVWYGALQDAIAETSGGTLTFEDAFAEYGRWLYFTGSRKPSFFEEGSRYPMVPELDTVGVDIIRPYIRNYSNYPAAVDRDFSFFPYYLGVSYIDLDVTTVDSGLTIDNFFGVTSSPEPVGWRVSVMGYNRFDPDQPVWLVDSLYRNRDQIVIEKNGGITDLIIVPVSANPYYGKTNNVYQFTALGTTSLKSSTTIRPPFPNPFKLSGVENPSLTTEIILSGSVDVNSANHASAFLDIYTVAGERIFSASESGSPNGRIWLDWNGRNEGGQEVASGVYILLVSVDDLTETFKVLVIR